MADRTIVPNVEIFAVVGLINSSYIALILYIDIGSTNIRSGVRGCVCN